MQRKKRKGTRKAPRKAKYLHEHPISKLLWDAGFIVRGDLATALKCSKKILTRKLTDPKKYMTMEDIEIVAFLADQKLSTIVMMVYKNSNAKKLTELSVQQMKFLMIKGQKWHDLP